MATAQAPASVLVPAPATAPPPTVPGWKTSEFWVKLLAIFVSALLASGLIPSTSTAGQVAAIIMTMLGALGYTAARTSAKNTAARANAAGLVSIPLDAAQAGSFKPAAIVSALMVGTLIVAGTQHSTASPGKAAVAALVTTRPASSCTELLGPVSNALVGADYGKAVDALITSAGAESVRCALLGVASVTTAGKSSGAAALSPLELRAKEMLVSHGWSPPAGAGQAVSP